MEPERIDRILKQSRYRPSPGETERFADAVMAALGEELLPVAASLSRRPWYGPAAGLAFAALALSLWPAAPALDDGAALADVAGVEWEAR